MGIISLFPGGGGAELNIKAYATVGNRPASADEGAIAVITSTAIGDVYVSIDEPSTKPIGDIWIFIGPNALANVDIGNNIFLPPRAIYQSDGSAWVLLESYVYTSSAWIEITMYVYYYGSEILATWTKNAGDQSLLKEASALNFKGYVGADTDFPIDLSDIDTITIVSKFNSGNDNNVARLTPGNLAQIKLPNPATATASNMDVSSITGSYYLDIYVLSNDPYRNNYVYSILLSH